MMPARSFPLALVVTLTAALGLGSSGCHEKTVSAAPEAAPDAGSARLVKFDPAVLARLGVKVAQAGGATADIRIQVPGTLEYNLERYAEIGTLVQGRVAQAYVRVGEPVKKGQKLATILVPSIASAQADYIAAEAAAQQAKEHAGREQALLEKELTTAHEAHVAKSEATQTEANLKANAARLQALGVAVPSGGTVVQGAGTLTLTSPIDGVVVRRDAVLGRFLDPTEKAFVVADPSTLWATVEVYESDIAYFREGSAVDIVIDAMPGKVVKGQVALLEPQIGSQSRALRGRISVDNHDGSLRPGLFVRAAVTVPEEVSGTKLVVPSAAVQPLGDSDVMFVERGPGTFEVRAVRLGRRTSQLTEVVEGLSKNERIAVEGTFLLRGEVTKQ